MRRKWPPRGRYIDATDFPEIEPVGAWRNPERRDVARASADAIPLRVGIIPTIANAGYYAADKFGYFSAENIAVTAQSFAAARRRFRR